MALDDLVKNTLGINGLTHLQRISGLEDNANVTVEAVISQIAGLIRQKGTTESSLRSMLDAFSPQAHLFEGLAEPAAVLSHTESLSQAESAGADLLKYLASDKLGGITDQLAESTQAPRSAIVSLMKLVTPMAAYALVHQVNDKGFESTSELFFGSDDSPDNTDDSESSSAETPENEWPNMQADDRPTLSRLLPWLVLLLTSLALLYFIGRGCAPTSDLEESPEIAETSSTVEDNMDELNSAVMSAMTQALSRKGEVPIEAFILHKVKFDEGTARLTISARNALNGIAEMLRNNPNAQLRIEGHTDNSGDARKNLEMSNQRALAVKNYLQEQSIDPARLRAIGRGQTKPVASNNTEEGRVTNQRVEVYITANPE